MSIILILNVLGGGEDKNEPLLRFFQKKIEKTNLDPHLGHFGHFGQL